MDDLISSMSGGMHVSQDAYELEAFKASLARTLSAPPSPSQSSNGYGSPSSRPSSLSLSTYYPYESYNDDAELAAAFAGDAFAPMWKKQQSGTSANEPWRGFQQQQAQSAFTQNALAQNAPHANTQAQFAPQAQFAQAHTTIDKRQ